MRDHSQHIQVSYAEAVSAILGACSFAPGREAIPVEQAFGRILSTDATAQLDMPNALTCNMDSVAIRWADVASGMPDTSSWERGLHWEFANTGVAMPKGFDTAVVVENVRFYEDDTKIELLALPSRQYAGTSPVGSRMHKGEVLVEKGTLITPLLAAYIASGGNAQVEVVPKPRVAFIPTGNELVPVQEKVSIGKNIDSNSVLMRGKIEQWGGEPVMCPICPDDPAQLETALRTAANEADIVVVNAGSSKGSDDYCLEVLERIGSVLYHQTSHGPGHHSSCSVVNGTPVIGISGPPGGAAFTADFYVLPAVDAYLGRGTQPVRIKVRLGEAFAAGMHPGAGASRAAGEVRPREGGDFFSVRQLQVRQAEDGMLVAYPAKGAHLKAPLAESMDAYYLLDCSEGATQPQPGEAIEVFLRP